LPFKIIKLKNNGYNSTDHPLKKIQGIDSSVAGEKNKTWEGEEWLCAPV
jgi:hypothetical protein